MLVMMLTLGIGAGFGVSGLLPEVYARTLSDIQAGDTVQVGTSGKTYNSKTFTYSGTPQWKVLAVEGSGNSKKALLLSVGLWTPTTQFASSSNTWSSSTAKQWCADFYSSDVLKDLKDKSLVSSTTKTDGSYSGYTSVNLTGENVFFLSAYEYNQYKSSISKASSSWWLRSGSTGNDGVAGSVNTGGGLAAITWTAIAARAPLFI